ncbi:hypothetical protein Tco_1563773 [Tanacetum coccineum]
MNHRLVGRCWNDPRDFAKPVKAISLPQDVPSTFDRRLIELENQVQRLMEAHLAPKSSVQVNKIASSCEICSGPHDTQYCMENPEQAFVDYASSCTDEAGGKWYMASQDARLSKFKADFKQQQGEMTNKIDTVLKAINDRITEHFLVTRPKSKNDKVRVNTEESAVKPEPELKNTVGCNLNPSDGPGKPNKLEDLIKIGIDWNKKPKRGDGAWHAKIRLIDPDEEKFTKTFQSIPTTRKLSEKENPSEIIDLDHFHNS